jgi:hypothetical protein
LRLTRIATTGAALVAAAAVVIAVGHRDESADKAAVPATPPSSQPVKAVHASLPATAGAYLGVYVAGVPASYAGVTAFTTTTGIRPDVVVYYSAWLEPFQAGFALAATRHHAVPLVQIDPSGVSLAAIASGRYDSYLRAYAAAVRSYGRPVILSFGHEMNATWYQWGNQHTSPKVFVAAWRHIVTQFRAAGADDVTWLWTINIINTSERIASPGPWWPGQSYVTWIGLDGYYSNAAESFPTLFGPTVAAVRALTSDPVLITETGVAPTVSRQAKIPDLFAGVRADRLLGLVWFDAVGTRDWRLDSAADAAAFRRQAETYRPTPSS